MAPDGQITIVTSLWGRYHFEEFLKGIMVSIFFENERICLHICIFVEQPYLFVFLEIFYSF